MSSTAINIDSITESTESELTDSETKPTHKLEVQAAVLDKFSNGLHVTAIVFVNFLACKLWLSLPYFADVRSDLYVVCSIIFSVLSLGVFVIAKGNRIHQSLFQIVRLNAEVDALEVLGLLVCFLVLPVLGYQKNWEALFFANQLFLGCLFFVTLQAYLRRHFKKVVLKETTLNNPSRSQSSVEQVGVGDSYKVEAGSQIYTDALVLEGLAEVEERQLTTKSQLRIKNEGCFVFAGSRVMRGSLVLKVERLAQDSLNTTCLPQVKHLVAEIDDNSDSLDKSSNALGLGVIFVAIFAFIFWSRQQLPIALILPIVAGVLFSTVLLRSLEVLPIIQKISVMNLFKIGVLAPIGQLWQKLAKLKNFVLMLDQPKAFEQLQIKEFKLLDDLVSVERVKAVLYSMASLTNRDFDRELVNFIQSSNHEYDLYSPENFYEYGSKGISATIESNEFSFGTEEFLIERGVHVQASDVSNQAQGLVHYLALDEYVVARVEFSIDFIEPLSQLKSKLSALRVSFSSWSEALSRQELQVALDGLALTRDSLRGSLEFKDVVRGLEQKQASAIIDASAINNTKLPLFKFFDRLRWEIDDSCFTVFGTSLEPVYEAWKLVLSYQRFKNLILVAAVIFMLIMLFGAASSLLGPMSILAFEALFMVVIYFSCIKLIEK